MADQNEKKLNEIDSSSETLEAISESIVTLDNIINTHDTKANEEYKKEFEAYSAYDQDSENVYNRKIENAYHSRQLKQIDNILSDRKNYAYKIFLLVVFWLIGLALLLLLQGFRLCSFNLDAKILITLIGGTTLNILGFFTVVANFLFPKNGYQLLEGRKNIIDAVTQNKKKSQSPKKYPK